MPESSPEEHLDNQAMSPEQKGRLQCGNIHTILTYFHACSHEHPFTSFANELEETTVDSLIFVKFLFLEFPSVCRKQSREI